jgi:hypothetical protein
MDGRRLLAGLGILVGVVGLALDFWVIVVGLTVVTPDNPVARPLVYTIFYYLAFLTHIANFGVLLAYVSDLTPARWLGWFRGERTRAMLGGLIALVGLFYHFLLAPTLHLSGPIVYANVLLHYVSPVVYLIWWGAFLPHGGVRFRDIPLMLVGPLIYFAWTLLRGLVAGDYPYTIIDVGKLGYPLVLLNALQVFVELTVLLLVVIGADKLLARRHPIAEAAP